MRKTVKDQARVSPSTNSRGIIRDEKPQEKEGDEEKAMSLKLMKEHTFPKNTFIFLSYFTEHTFAQKIFSFVKTNKQTHICQKKSLLLRLTNKHRFTPQKILLFC